MTDTEPRQPRVQQNLPTRAHLAALEIARMRGRPILVWCQHPPMAIDYDCLARVRRALGTGERLSKIDVLMHSGGGDPDAAYRTLLAVRQRADEVSVLVPFWAKSAATLVALGAEEILLGQNGELGPLDTQVWDPRGSKDRLSALNEFKSMEYIRIYGGETLTFLAQLLRELNPGMDVPASLEHAEAALGAFTEPLYGQIRPHDLGKYRQHLALAEEYASRAMRRYGYRFLSRWQIDQIVRSLVWDYPAHGFVIDLHEAQEIGLKASEMPPELDALCQAVVLQGLNLLELVQVPDPTNDHGASLPEGATLSQPDGLGDMEGSYDERGAESGERQQEYTDIWTVGTLQSQPATYFGEPGDHPPGL